MRAAMNERTTPNGAEVKVSSKTTNFNPTGGLVVKCEISVELSRGHDNTLRFPFPHPTFTDVARQTVVKL